MKLLFYLSPLMVAAFVLGAIPDPPKLTKKDAKTSATVDCTGPVAFSATGTAKVFDTGIVSYRTILVDHAVGFSRETGAFTIHCPGIYYIGFAGYSDQPNTKIVLKKRTINNDTWSNVISAGSVGGGGQNQVLLNLQVKDQIGVWLLEGGLNTPHDQEIPSTSFTAYRISQK